MKVIKSVASAVAAVMMFVGGTAVAADKTTVKVVMVGIGAKNKTFDENRFPDLKFAYTPGLVSQAQAGDTGKSALALMGKSAKEIFKGQPEFLEKWWDKQELRHRAILFDKNGVAYWEGILPIGDAGKGIKDVKGDGEKTPLEKALKKVQDGDTTKFKDKKEFKPKGDGPFGGGEEYPMLNMKIPAFDVTLPSGEVTSINKLIEDGKPTLVVFFQISSTIDTAEAKKADQSDKSAGAFFSAMTKGAAGAKLDQVFLSIESELFGFDARDKSK